MDKQFVKGESHEDKFASIEANLRHMSKRLGTKVVGIMPPVPIFWSKDKPDPNGLIMRILIPYGGNIPYAYFYCEKMNKKSLVLSATVITDLASSGVKVEVKQSRQKYTLNWQVDAGSILEVRIDDPTAAEGILIGIMTYPDIDKLHHEKFVLNEVLKLDEDTNAKAEVEKSPQIK